MFRKCSELFFLPFLGSDGKLHAFGYYLTSQEEFQKMQKKKKTLWYVRVRMESSWEEGPTEPQGERR